MDTKVYYKEFGDIKTLEAEAKKEGWQSTQAGQDQKGRIYVWEKKTPCFWNVTKFFLMLIASCLIVPLCSIDFRNHWKTVFSGKQVEHVLLHNEPQKSKTSASSESNFSSSVKIHSTEASSQFSAKDKSIPVQKKPIHSFVPPSKGNEQEKSDTGIGQPILPSKTNSESKANDNSASVVIQPQQTSVPTKNHQSCPKLEFDQTVLLSEDQIIELKISTKNNRSELPEYSDSVFEIFYVPEGYKVTRRIAEPLPEIQKNPAKICLPSKRELKVSMLPPNPETLQKIGKIAREWQALSYEKGRRSSDSSQVFTDLRQISKLIAECMEQPEVTSWIWDSIYITEDVAQKEIQAIALTKAPGYTLTIAHMATHPRNVRSSVNETETTRVEGAASALVNHMITHLPPDCEEIYAESVQSARIFYEEKLGFEALDPIVNPPREMGTIPMLLSAEKIQSLIQKAA